MREAAYRVYHYPIESQTKILDALILNRHKLATLAGFPSFAHRAMKGTLAETPGKFLMKSAVNEGNISSKIFSKSFALKIKFLHLYMYVLIMLEKFNKTPLNTKTIYICMTFSPALFYKHACSLVSSEMAEAFLNALSERIKPL